MKASDADALQPATEEGNTEEQMLGDSAGAPTSQGSETQSAKGLNLLQVVGSVFAAGLGVQSSKNRERDFKQGRAITFIVAGLLFTALFIGAVTTVVSLVLSNR